MRVLLGSLTALNELQGLVDGHSNTARQAAGLANVQSLPSGDLPGQRPEATPDNEQAIGELWTWYLEWGQVLRTQAGDGRILRQAGFLSGDRRTKPVRRKNTEVR